MKILSFFVGLLLLSAITLTAQNTFNKGDKVLNLAVGIGNRLYTGSHYSGLTPPISASLEVGVKDNLFDDKSSLGIGGFVGYAGAKWDQAGHGWKYSDYILGVKGALHYQLIDKLDTYTGILLGYDIVSAKWYGSGSEWVNTGSSSGFAWSWFLGGRYYFTDKVAGLIELGYGISYFKVGVALKLK
jgi:hypothetical protein